MWRSFRTARCVLLIVALLAADAAAREMSPAGVHAGDLDLRSLRDERRLVWLPAEAVRNQAHVPVDVRDRGGCPEVAAFVELALHRAFATVHLADNPQAVVVHCRAEGKAGRFVVVDTVSHSAGTRFGAFLHSLTLLRTPDGDLARAEQVAAPPDTGTWDDAGSWYLGFVAREREVTGLVTIGRCAASETSEVTLSPVTGGEPMVFRSEVVDAAELVAPESSRTLVLTREENELRVVEVSGAPQSAVILTPADLGAFTDPVHRAPTLAVANLEVLQWYRRATNGAHERYDPALTSVEHTERRLQLDIREFRSPCPETLPTRVLNLLAELNEHLDAPLRCTSWRPVPDRPWERMRVQFVAGRFVVLAPADLVMTSSDGNTWATNEQPGEGALADLGWNGVDLLAVGSFGQIWSSHDGLGWEPRESGTTANLLALTWTGDRWIAVGGEGVVLTSVDGITWKADRLGGEIEFNDVVAVDGRIVAVARAGERGAVASWDGRSGWRLAQLPMPLLRVGFQDGLFVAVEPIGTTLVSSDGRAWSVGDCRRARCLSRIEWGQTERCVDASGRIEEMTNGQWYQLTLSPGYPDYEPEWSEVAAGNDTLIAVGRQYGQGAILHEQQGDLDVRKLWLTKPRRVVWTGGNFLAPAGFQRLTLQSSDGIKWTWKGREVCDEPPHMDEGPVAWFQGRLIALREDGRTGESADGLTWTWSAQTVDTERRRATALVAGATAIVAFGPQGLFLQSTDGRLWRPVAPPLPHLAELESVVWTGSEFLGAGGFDGVLRSADGLAWERLPGPGVYSSHAVAGSSGVVVTMGSDTILRRDRDGSWCVAEELGSGNSRWHLAGIESGGFLAVDHSGTIMVSLDGAEWWTVLRPERRRYDERLVFQTAVEDDDGRLLVLATTETGVLRSECRWW